MLSICVDFDGVLFNADWPNIGTPRKCTIRAVKWAAKRGHSLGLWTCRCGEKLLEAVIASALFGVSFDGINQPFSDNVLQYTTNPRKVSADIYLDDRSMLAPKSDIVMAVYVVAMVLKHEREDRKSWEKQQR